MKPKNVSTAPASAKPDGLHEFALDDEHGDRAEDEAAEDRAAAEHVQAVVEHALVPHLADQFGHLRRG